MSRFHGPQPGYKSQNGSFRRNGPKGVLKALKAIKREEAEARQEVYRVAQKVLADLTEKEQQSEQDLPLVQD